MTIVSTATDITQSSYEEKTHIIARQLLTEGGKKDSFFSKMRDKLRWDDKLLAWMMENPNLRVQMFRTIDCLPALTTKAEIARHLQEYLTDASVELPQLLKGLLDFTNAEGIDGQAAATTLTTAVERLARKYIAGETLPEATGTIVRLRQQSMAFTLDILGEAVVSEVEAKGYLDRCVDAMAQLSAAAQKWTKVPQIEVSDSDEPLSQVQVSVKLTAFYSQFDPLDVVGSREKVGEKIRFLLRQAQELGVAVHFDMEQYAYKTATLDILQNLLLEEEFKDRTDIGITVQAYLRDSYGDLQQLIAWAKQRQKPITVRLVKGAYWDSETILSRQNHWPTPVYNTKSSTDANFERLTQLLLENHEYLYAAIGSHNVRSQALAIAIAETLGIPRRRVEFQVLYGMADDLAAAIAQRGHRVRVYCPTGDLIPGMAYLIRRLLENTANTSFLRRRVENTPIDRLLVPPAWGNGDADGSRVFPTSITTVPNSGVSRIDPAANTDYAIAASRQAASDAIAAVKAQLGKTYLPLIDGEWVATEKTLPSVNPAKPTEIVATIGQINLGQADLAVAAAKKAFPNWKRTPVAARVAIIRKVGDLLASRRHELNAWMVLEAGKTLTEADAELSEAVDFCYYYATEMERLGQEIVYDVAGENDRYLYQPKGIVTVISPWNFPLAIPVGMTIAALVTGNCALLKPAALTATIAAKFAEILVEAGIPAGVFQYIPGSGSVVGSHLVKHPDISTIVFTGSQKVGCQIYADAAIVRSKQKHMKRTVAEMGGKNGIIVDESADLDVAVKGIVYSAFGYSGQKCSACSRVIVVASIYEAFIERLIAATASLNIGDPTDPSTKVGPVIDDSARRQIREYIEIGKIEARLALELAVPESGYYVSPTIFTHVDPASRIAKEEIFGPVLAVICAPDFDSALTIANDTDFALTGGIYSRTPSHIERAKNEFEVGNLYINRGITGAIVGRQPFGGFKLSGVGSKAGGPDYLLQFLEPRTITENIQRQGFAPIDDLS